MILVCVMYVYFVMCVGEDEDAPAAQIFKALNATLIKLVADGKSGVMLCALVQVFTICAAERQSKVN